MITLTKKQETDLRYLVHKFDLYPQNISRYRLIEVMRDIITDPILTKKSRPQPLRKKYKCINTKCIKCGCFCSTNCRVYKHQRTLLACPDNLLQEYANA